MGVCVVTLIFTTPGSTSAAARSHVYSANTLRRFDTNASRIIGCDLRKLLFSLKLWSPRYKYRSHLVDWENKRDVGDQKTVHQKKTAVSVLKFVVMNVWSLRNRLDYVIDHANNGCVDVNTVVAWYDECV